MKLVGSTPSPYVRRIRLWLAEADYEFVDLNIYSEEGREVLRTYTPAMKIPMLVDGDQSVFDSRVIYRYLNDKMLKETLTLEQENAISLVDSLQESFIIQLMSLRSGIDIESNILILKLQEERIDQTLPVLEQMVRDGLFDNWQYPAICLFALLDWVTFRELYDFSAYSALENFRLEQLQRPIVQKTDPRQVA
ncbi:glutathione S-transferase family protein [Oceanospirillum beijerinckii]|uniref:glutathione S-transferase family protein n=1 Tax=Oceanospirillum beijerinckii TaxID=64976 RepID=UPI000419F586|nr:glutathione S-transferase family protein [Oceanospirillum beijerinckii]